MTRAAFSYGDCTLSRDLILPAPSLAQSLVEDDATAVSASAAAMALCQEEGEGEGSDAGNVKEESAKDNRSEGGGGDDDNEKAGRVDGDGEEGDVVVCGGGENGGSGIGDGIRPTKSPPMRRKMRRGLRTDIPMRQSTHDRRKMLRLFHPLLPLATYALKQVFKLPLFMRYPFPLLLKRQMHTALQMPNPVATCLSYVGQPCRGCTG